MSSIYLDPEHSDLVWMEFDGDSWDKFSVLLSDLMTMTQDLEEPYCLIFHPLNDMPRGNPMPHIKRMIRFKDQEPKFEHMIAILPDNMKIAATFANITLQLFPTHATKGLGMIVTSKEEALATYLQYRQSKTV